MTHRTMTYADVRGGGYRRFLGPKTGAIRGLSSMQGIAILEPGLTAVLLDVSDESLEESDFEALPSEESATARTSTKSSARRQMRRGDGEEE